MKWLQLSTAALACIAAANAQTLTGRWTGNASTTDNGLEIVVALNQGADGKITGYVVGPRSQDTIVDGRNDGGKITLEAERPGRNGDTQKVTYTAVLEDGKLKLTMPMGGGGRGPGRGPGGPGAPGAPGAAPGQAGAGMAAGPGRAAGAGPEGGPPRGPGVGAGGPGGGRGPQVYELARVSTEVPKPLPPRPAPVSLSMPGPVKSNGLAKTPPMGWNSWNKFRNLVSDQMVREMADGIVKSGMRDAGYVYVNIDDTWQGRRDANGNITTNNKFPDMKALSAYVHSKGLKLGIYSSPGPKTCAGYEGSYQHEEQDAKMYAAWGIDYLKYDWCSASQVYDGTQATMAAAYAKMGEALLNSGHKIVYSLCQYGNLEVGEWGEKVGGNLWRTTGDISDRWQSMNDIGFNRQPGREKYAGPGHWNDPDMLEIGNGGMTDIEYQTHMSLWSLLASPLLAGNDLRDMKPSIAAILMNKEVIAVDQDKLGKQAARVAKEGDWEVWSRPLADGGHAVGLFNRGAETAKVTAKWSDLGVTGKHKIRDLWKHADLESMVDAYTAEVPSHGVVMIKIAK
jgi:alpha-galactosidase